MTLDTPRAKTDSDPTRLLLQFIAHVQDTGQCGYPPLEGHLHRYAEELRSRELAAADERQTAAEDRATEEKEPVAEAMPTDCPTPYKPASPEPIVSETSSPDLDATAPEDVPGPGCESTTEADKDMIPHDSKGLSDRPSLEGQNQEPTVADHRCGKPASMLAGADRAGSCADLSAAAQEEQPEDMSPSTCSAAEPTPIQTPDDAQLARFLRFREQVQSSGFCDHPELQERLAAHLNNRELPQGNSRLALQRLELRCQTELRQALAQLEVLNPSAISLRGERQTHSIGNPASQLSPSALLSVAAGLRLVRHHLADGLASYGCQIDAPQRRMLQRQLSRAERTDRRIHRSLAKDIDGASLLADLQILGCLLTSLLEQWWPEELDPGHERLPAQIRLRPDEQAQGHDPCNAIRPRLAPQRPR